MMSCSKIVVFLLFLAFMSGPISCGKPISKKVFEDGVDMLLGEITRDDLFLEFPDWYENYSEYKPDSTIINALSEPHPDLNIEIFMGTWCSDSRREVPRFFKTLDESNFADNDQIRLWAVDKNKSLESGLTEEKNILNVATFIFYRNEKEIGRIIEQTDHGNIESDILSIIKGT